MKRITDKEMAELAQKYGADQIIIVMRKGGKLAGPDDEQHYGSHGIDTAPWWFSKIRKEIFKHF